jgi:spore germination protein KB
VDTISAAQFFGMMFVSRITITIALNAQYAAGESLLDGILSYLLAMAAGFLIALPVWTLQRQDPSLPIGAKSVRVFGQIGKLLPLCYILYFLVMNGVSLALFQLFLLDNVNPDFPAFLILAVLVGVAAYGAWRGLEAIARTSACVLVLLLLGTVLVFALVSRRFDWENLEPLMAGGTSQLLQGAALFLSRTSLFAEMAVLLPFVRGRKLLGFTLWAGGTSLFVGVLIFLIAGCLGQYAYTQNFPVYALTSISEIASMQRLDAVFTGVWMMGLIVQTACGLYACRVCASSLVKSDCPPWVVIPGGVVMVALGVGIASSYLMQTVFMDTRLWLILTGAVSLLLPLILLAGESLRRKGAKL